MKYLLCLLSFNIFLLSFSSFAQDLEKYHLVKEKNKILLKNQANKLIKSFSLTEEAGYYGIDNRSKFVLYQQGGETFLYDIKKNVLTSRQLETPFTISAFGVKDSKTLLLGNDKGQVVSAALEKNQLRIADQVETSSSLPVKKIHFSSDGNRFYILHKKELYKEPGFVFRNSLISDLQTKSSHIGFQAYDKAPSGWHKTSLGFTGGRYVTDLDLLETQMRNAEISSTSRTQSAKFFAYLEGSPKELLTLDEVSSLSADSKLKHIVASFRIKDKTHILDLDSALNGDADNFVKGTINQHNHFISLDGDRIFLANADGNSVKVVSLKNQKILKEIKLPQNIRSVIPFEKGAYMLDKAGNTVTAAFENGKVLVSTGSNLGVPAARDIQPLRKGNFVEITLSNGERKRVFLPQTCASIFRHQNSAF